MMGGGVAVGKAKGQMGREKGKRLHFEKSEV